MWYLYELQKFKLFPTKFQVQKLMKKAEILQIAKEARFTVVIYTFLNNWAKNFPPPEVSQLCPAKVPLVWLWAVVIWAKHWSRETMFLSALMLACLGIKYSKDLIILIWVSSRNQAKFKCLCNDFTLKSNATILNFLPLW